MRGGEWTVDAKAMLLHRELAQYHRDAATRARTDISYKYHQDFAARLNEEADRIQELIIFEEESWHGRST